MLIYNICFSLSDLLHSITGSRFIYLTIFDSSLFLYVDARLVMNQFITQLILCICAQSWPTLCDAVDYSLTASSVHVLTTISLSIPSANGHQGCSHVLGIVNSAAVNTGVPVS